MAKVIVNHDSKSYSVDNGVNENGYKFNNQGGGSQRTFTIETMNLDFKNMAYQVHFAENDTDEVNGYESPIISKRGVNGVIDPSWVTTTKIDYKKVKINAINKLFLSLNEIEPLTDLGEVKPEFI